MAGRNGPHNYWREDMPPSRGQWQTIAELALELLDEPQPTTRLAASQLTGVLRHGLEQPSPPSTEPASKPSSSTTGNGPTPAEPPVNGDGLASTGRPVVARARSSSRASRTGVRTAASSRTAGG